MSYMALYREWRPQMFDTVVGQEHVTITLQNAINTSRIAHAYLFCGPRGTGKTSTAKIFAKALNCIDSINGEPCNKCDNCLRITNGSSMDVLEIDAASNRGIDEIRDLREKVKFSPTEGKFKVYIIDEVHMLTTEAFNALLKTLEEPPSHVIFILATTEPHKIPLTILSRCQRFDFKRITIENIINRLEEIIQFNKLKVAEKGLWIIAKNAEGGMRDALSILDQCISYSKDGVIEIEDINSILGIVNTDIIYAMSKAIATSNITDALMLLDKMVQQGKDLKQFIKDIIEFYRNLLMYKVSNNYYELIQDYDDKQLNEIQEQYSKEKIIEILNLLSETERDIKWTNQPRLSIELSLIKTCENGNYQSVNELLERIEKLEEVIKDLPSQLQISKEESKKSKPKVLTSTVRNKISINSDENDIIGLEEIRKKWPEVLEGIKKYNKFINAWLMEGEPIHLKQDLLTIGFKEGYAFHMDKISQPDHKVIVEKALSKVLNKSMHIQCLIQETQSLTNSQNDVLIKKAYDLFGEGFVEIKD